MSISSNHMKKIILVGVTLSAFTAASYGQNISSLNQNGTNQTGATSQIGTGHQAYIDQTQGAGVNQGNLANIAQGSVANPGAFNNVSSINQKNGSKTNRAAIDQNTKPLSGIGNNTATINQNNNSGGDGTQIVGGIGSSQADIDFVRNHGGNWAGITQEGNGVNIQGTINQNNNSSSNFTNLYQNTNGSGAKTATVDQSNFSIGNTAILYQGSLSGGLAGAITGASGAIEQSYTSLYNIAAMYQTKGVQTALIQQNDFSSLNQALTDQSSVDNGNQATIRQTMFSSFNQATITQTAGAGRTATIDQVDNSVSNIAAINQKGATPGATASNAYITQTRGAANQALIDQDTRFGASAIINQHDGNGSYAKITQNTTYFDFGNSNVAEIEQTGGTLGAGNSATINQDYSVNTAKLKQDGQGNMATITQLIGDGNVVKGLSGSVAMQQGIDNTLTVTQNSGAIFGQYVPNTASVGQFGTGNMGIITQTGN
jgi:hypothetical protein